MRHVLFTAGVCLFAASPFAAAQAGDSNALGNLSASRALFDQLDANGDGYLSRTEASAAEPIAGMYDSMDTSVTLEKQARHGNAGITYDQFAAGIEAARSSGSFGPAVSGGQTYLVYPNGERELIKPNERDAAGQGGDGTP